MSRPLRSDRPITRTDRGAAHVAVVAGAAFAVLLLGLHITEPEYDPTWRFVSEYALGRTGWMMTLAFLALAVTLLSAALSILRHIQTIPGRLGPVILAVAAAGFVLAALFRTDPMTTPADAYTASMRLHLLGASLDYSPVGMLLASWGLSRTSRWHHLRRRLLLAAALPFLLMISFTISLPRDGYFGPDVYSGLIGRLLLLSYLLWTTTTAASVLRHADSSSLRRRAALTRFGLRTSREHDGVPSDPVGQRRS
jgi:uncharacterized membrane protein YkvI